MSSSIPQTSGIYKIICTSTGKMYIGSAANLQSRRRQHWSDLRLSKHRNQHLQSAWHKYGENAFSFVVIELVLLPFLLEREQYWLDKLSPFQMRGFNISTVASSSAGVKYSEEVRHARSESQKALWRSDEYRQMIIDRRGRSLVYGESIARSKACHWIVTDPNGVEQFIFNLRAFCRDRGLQHQNMLRVASGKGQQHKGWKCRRVLK